MEKQRKNRLAQEKSPYLLQHVANPVDWYPWSREAFQKAQKTDRPIFLSSGYSTCHWCHVMARESFMDEEVAEFLNENFICIKVDREERPDIDKVYMAFCQALTGQGGWPLTVIMTPRGLPFFAGTYFPKRRKGGYPGLLEILFAVQREWQENQTDLMKTGHHLTERMKGFLEDTGRETEMDLLSFDGPKRAFRLLHQQFDAVYGGFGAAPKFPTPSHLFFLLRYWKRTGEGEALAMVEKTLEGMYRGGIFHHIGSGFSRYSTDNKWLVPHFEKMLYDNALLIWVYLEAFLATKKDLYKTVAQRVLNFLFREMSSLEGGFYSAQDADTQGVEGGYYLWDLKEIKEILGEDASAFCQFYHITAQGNFMGKNIPHLWGSDLSLEKNFHQSRERLLHYRQNRAQLFVDDKILTGWNGLLLVALAKAGRILQDKTYVQAGEDLVLFLFEKLFFHDQLLARYRHGEGGIPATLDDYAFLISGLLEIYQSTQKADYREQALLLQRQQDALFWDTDRGGYYFSGDHGEELILRPREAVDGAMPSGNSMAASNLLYLYQITGEEGYRERAETLFQVFLDKENLLSNTFLLSSLLLYQEPLSLEISIGEGQKVDEKMLQVIHQTFLPFSILTVKEAAAGEVTLTACTGKTCLPPMKGVEAVKAFLQKKH